MKSSTAQGECVSGSDAAPSRSNPPIRLTSRWAYRRQPRASPFPLAFFGRTNISQRPAGIEYFPDRFRGAALSRHSGFRTRVRPGSLKPRLFYVIVPPAPQIPIRESWRISPMASTTRDQGVIRPCEAPCFSWSRHVRPATQRGPCCFNHVPNWARITASQPNLAATARLTQALVRRRKLPPQQQRGVQCFSASSFSLFRAVPKLPS
jgi:hypothetical protein